MMIRDVADEQGGKSRHTPPDLPEVSAQGGRETASRLPVLQDDRRAERRRKVREMCNLLRDDLYNRTGSGEASAIWTSPLKWIVEYGYEEAAEGYQPVWCEIRGPDGKVLARSEDADVEWLDGRLP